MLQRSVISTLAMLFALLVLASTQQGSGASDPVVAYAESSDLSLPALEDHDDDSPWMPTSIASVPRSERCIMRRPALMEPAFDHNLPPVRGPPA